MARSRRRDFDTPRERRVATAGVPRPDRESSLPASEAVARQRRFDCVYFVGNRYRGYSLVEAARSADRAEPRHDGTPGGLRFPPLLAGEDAGEVLQRAGADRRRREGRAATEQLMVLDQESLGRQVLPTVAAVRELLPGAAILLMLPESFRHLSTAQIKERSAVDRVAVWSGQVEDLAAMVWLMQDERTATADLSKGIPALMLVEDEPGLYGQFLSLIYTELLSRTRDLVPARTPADSLWRYLDHRPRILLAESFEEGMLVLGQYAGHLIGVITDLQFPITGEVQADAGIKLCELTRALRPTLPLIVQSNAPRSPAELNRVSAFYLNKRSETWLDDLRRIMLNFFGFGDFVFRDEVGVELASARNVEELRDRLARVPLASILFHGRRNHISTWLYIHGAHDLARCLRPLQGDGEWLRRRVLGLLDRYLAGDDLTALEPGELRDDGASVA